MKFDATIHLNLIKNQKYNIQETVFKFCANKNIEDTELSATG